MKKDLDENLYCIWVSPKIFLEEYLFAYKDLYYMIQTNCDEYKNFIFYRCTSNSEAFKIIKKFVFQPTIFILDGIIYFDFIKIFTKNLKRIKIIPKIIVLTKDEKIKNKINDMNNDRLDISFYNYNGINTSFIYLKSLIMNQINNNMTKNSEKRNLLNDPQFNRFYDSDGILIRNLNDLNDYTFEYIDCKEKLLLPTFYQSLIQDISYQEIDDFNNKLYNNSEYNEYKYPLKSFISIPNIPFELLSKYYLRIYTFEGKFYKNLNLDLRNNKFNDYLPYIKTLYKGIELKSLDLGSDETLYRATLLSNDEINYINKSLNKKIFNDLPAVYAFSKCFLSFSKDYNECLRFLCKKKFPDKSSALFFLEKDKKIDYSFSTHADIEQLSYIPNEKEVLFFPFSSFEIKSIKEIQIGGQNVYKIDLSYLGKYLKTLLKDEFFYSKVEELPDSKFKRSLIDSKLIKDEELNNKKIIDKYFSYKIKIYPEYQNIINSRIFVQEINDQTSREFSHKSSTHLVVDSDNEIHPNNDQNIKYNYYKIKVLEKSIDEAKETAKKHKFADTRTIIMIIFICLLILLFILLIIFVIIKK